MTYTGNFRVEVGKEDKFRFPMPEASSRVSSVFVPSSYLSPPPAPVSHMRLCGQSHAFFSLCRTKLFHFLTWWMFFPCEY